MLSSPVVLYTDRKDLLGRRQKNLLFFLNVCLQLKPCQPQEVHQAGLDYLRYKVNHLKEVGTRCCRLCFL